ncbi:hypothetical protein Ancab_027027 [Ancistrocladus abbreviatus]
MSDSTVIVTVVNKEWARPGSVLDLFLESFQAGQGAKRLLNHLIIAASGAQAFRYCDTTHPYCCLLTTDDADILWLRSPFGHFKFHDVINVARKDHRSDYRSKRSRVDLGILHVRADDTSTELFRYWFMARVLNPSSDDQSIFESFEKKKLCEMNFLDPSFFGGLCQQNKDMSKVVTVHASCCDSTENKVNDLRLALDEWKSFSMPPVEIRSPNRTSLCSWMQSRCMPKGKNAQGDNEVWYNQEFWHRESYRWLESYGGSFSSDGIGLQNSFRF